MWVVGWAHHLLVSLDKPHLVLETTLCTLEQKGFSDDDNDVDADGDGG